MKMNGQSFASRNVFDQGDAIVDSGTTLLYIPQDGLNAWQKVK